MNIYVVKDNKGFLHIIHGDYLRARKVSKDGDIRLVEYGNIGDVIHHRLPFEKLKKL